MRITSKIVAIALSAWVVFGSIGCRSQYEDYEDLSGLDAMAPSEFVEVTESTEPGNTTYYEPPEYEKPTTILSEPEPDPEPEYEFRSLGVFRLTAYCPCAKCCGKSDGITATGTIATQGRTIAVDPSVIPYGTKIMFNDHIYVAEDCGGAIGGNRIDVFFDDHQEAWNFGAQYLEVFLVIEKSKG